MNGDAPAADDIDDLAPGDTGQNLMKGRGEDLSFFDEEDVGAAALGDVPVPVHEDDLIQSVLFDGRVGRVPQGLIHHFDVRVLSLAPEQFRADAPGVLLR